MTYEVVSFSGGKDSTAMLLHMIELDYQIDEVITCDTGYEFPAMYRHIEKVKKILDKNKIKHTTLKSEHSFSYYLAGIERKDGGKGYGWPCATNRWCTANLKTRLIRRYLKEKREKGYVIVQNIGLAYDEQDRIDRKSNQNDEFKYPLVEWKWTEADALQYCREREYDWEGLYDVFSRVSCYLCPLQPISELRKLYNNYPELWEEMRRLDSLTPTQYRSDYSLADFEKRFDRENLAKRYQTNIDNFAEVL